MRLQLSFWLIIFFPFIAHGQADSIKNRKLTKGEINFIYGYYEQDGDNAAVTGGTGTEELTAHIPRFIIYIPTRKNNGLTIDAGVTVYSSASTDNIDFERSSASSKEAHTSINLSYQWQTKKKATYAVKTNFDVESDYRSRGLGVSSTIPLNKGKKFSWSIYTYFDDLRWGWLDPGEWRGQFLIYPEELRDTAWFDNTKRTSVLTDFSYSSRISNRLRIQVSQGIYYQSGLLSTPFHRVFFENEDDARVERFPDNRWKSSSAFRLNYFINDWLIVKSFNRLYTDTFGVLSYTTQLEFPIKLSFTFTAYPIFRFHTQDGARFWRPFKEHQSDARYYSSDYDLSSFNATTTGFGFRYTPAFGLFNKAKALDKSVIKSLGLRVSRYNRSDGLEAWMGSFRVSIGKL